MKTCLNVSLSLLIVVLLCGCGPSEAEQQATVTQIAAAVYATQTAGAPTATPTFTPSSTPTVTPTSTATPTSTPTLVPTRTPTPAATLSRPQAEAILHEFMSAMVKKETDRAVVLFSDRAGVTTAELKKLVQGNNYVLFDGYRDVIVTTIYGPPAFSNQPWGYAGGVWTVEATVNFEGDFTGTIKAFMEYDGAAWRLYGINVIPSTDKIKDWLARA